MSEYVRNATDGLTTKITNTAEDADPASYGRIKMKFCAEKVKEILDYVRPNNWEIIYCKPDEINLSEWKREYLQLIDNEDYFFVAIDGEVMYAVNVTGDSTLTAVQELVTKLASKF